ncbi:multi-sensor signal transduction multi-kinase [Psychromonas sp. CNPT3]|uniref:sensor histidine kinase n=1 Tax=Psychromonas sp. CNPT3 TaxID=314282 RepID=UPI00006E8AD5|nr:HAMP domain-containing sensor histidine kinase [Psychromonas sp. CNPT3]AGH80537.1 multi-sensor signal transduction multi-kinase [Psychromonas sp. CNPT3]
MKKLFILKKSDLLPLHWAAITCVILLGVLFYASISSMGKLRLTEKNRQVTNSFIEHLRLYSDQMTMLSLAYRVNSDPRYFYSYKKTLQHLCENNASHSIHKHSIDKHSIDKHSKINIYTQLLESKISLETLKIKQQPCEINYTLQEEKKTEAENLLLAQIQESFKKLIMRELNAFKLVSVYPQKQNNHSIKNNTLPAFPLLYGKAYLQEKSTLLNSLNELLQASEQRSLQRLHLFRLINQYSVCLSFLLFLVLFLLMLYNLHMSKQINTLFVKSLRKKVADRTFDLFENRENLKSVMHEMEATKNQLVESEKMASLGNLVSGIAHEVNTPLGVGLTIASHLQDETQSLLKSLENDQLKRSELEMYGVDCEQSCRLLLTNLQRAAKLISSFKLIAVDQCCEDVRIFKMSEYLQEVFLSLQHALKGSAISLEITIADPKNEPLIETLPGAISQITTNLVMNAFIHGFSQGQKEGKIIFNLEYEKGVMLLTVSDNGLGMAPDVCKKIFEPFYTTKRGNGGSGLGLSIVYNLVVHQLKGRITCQSELGKGSVFLVKFPFKRQPSEGL